MTKATYGSKKLFGGLQFQRVSSMSLWQGAWRQAGRHGAGAVSERSHLETHAGGRERQLGMVRDSETSKPT